ncbi:MAG: hypothetical protein AAF226_17340, partial [Verrucomicrobiota bacterium]
MNREGVDVYGCKLMTLQDGEITPRLHWPNKGLETMFTGCSDDNMLPHSSVMMKAAVARKAGNYQERAIGLGADDYHLWYRIHGVGGTFYRDDEVRNVVYRIHEANSLKIRRERFGGTERANQGKAASPQQKRRNLFQRAAAAAGFTALAGGAVNAADSNELDQDQANITPAAKVERIDPPHS